MVEKNAKVRALPPETLSLETEYTFTLNLAEMIGVFPVDIDKYEKWLSTFFKPIRGMRFRMYPEVSSKGRLHMHGVVSFTRVTAIVRYYEVLFAEQLRISCEMDTIADAQTWAEYVTKQKWIMETYCEKIKRIYEYTNDSVPEMVLKPKKGGRDLTYWCTRRGEESEEEEEPAEER